MIEVPNSIELTPAPAVVNGLAVSEIQAELDRILKSRVFVHSHRIRSFLQFVVEECLFGRQHRLKEYLIGLEVFNRHDDFDPRVDSIVRVEARRLRTKLEEYYEKEGQESQIRIELRKGSYVPVFEQRSPGIHGGYSGYSHVERRHSLSISRLAALDGDTDFVDGMVQQLSHGLLKGGHFKVLVDGNGIYRSSGNGNARPNHSTKPDYILEGRIEAQGHDRHLHLQLMDVKDKAYVWSESGDPDGIEQLVGSLNRAMTTSVSRPENGRTRSRSTQRESFDLYLQGHYQCKFSAPETLARSVALFQEAVGIDPNYAAAWASLAEASLLSSVFGLVHPRETGVKMREAAHKAVALNPLLPEAYVALGSVKSLLDWDWVAGERDFQRALQLDGRDSVAHMAYGVQLACRGMFKPAIVEAECGLEMDPASLTMNFLLGWLLCAGRQYDQAIAQHTAVARLAPEFPLSFVGLGWAELGRGQYSEALAHFLQAGELMPGWPVLTGCVGHCHAMLNQRTEAAHQLAQLKAARQHESGSPVSVAAVQIGLGQTEEALESLEQAADQRDCSLPLQLLNPEFDAIRTARRYTALMEKLGLKHMAPASVKSAVAS